MPTIRFSSLPGAEVVSVEFLSLRGEKHRRTMLVDSGFTGQSSVILGDHEDSFVRAMMSPAAAAGALQGEQVRAWVRCQILAIGFQQTLIAILTDLRPLSLPETVQGMVGLSFLRNFQRWGAEQTTEGWQFFLDFDEV